MTRYPDQAVDKHSAMMTRQKMLNWLEEQVIELCEVLHTLSKTSELSTWSLSLVEGIDVVLLVLRDALDSNDASSWTTATQLMGDRGELLRKLRDASLQTEESLLPDERTKLIRLASPTEHVFMLMTQLAHECRLASRVDEAFLAHHELEDIDAPPPLSVFSEALEPVRSTSG